MVLKDERIGEDENKLAQYEVELGENQQKLKFIIVMKKKKMK